MKDLGEGINGPPLLDPCQGRAVLAGRGGSPGTALLPGRARHGHEAGRAGPDLGRAF